MLKMDRISSLPDGVISHILSFLPLKKAARASVLSKKWRTLFAFSPYLNLFDSKEDNLNSFMDFVDRVLAVSENSPIKMFSLTCRKGFEPACINRWIRDVLNRGVMDLDLDVDAEDVYSLPFEIFTCKTIVELKLTGFSIDVLPEDASPPALKTLILKSVQFYSLHACAFEKLLSACPVLQDLVLYDFNGEQWKWSRVVSSPSLERLAIERTDFYDFDGSDFGSITFDTPNVTHLDYHDFVPGSYPIVNLDSLVEANLDLVVTVDHTWDVGFADVNDPITRNPTNLIKGLRNVKVMKLTQQSLEMFYFFRIAISVFENLVQLSIGPIACWRGLPFLVNKSPILETLSIEGCLHYVCDCLSGYSFLLSCPLKVLKITEYYGTTEEVELLKHFLAFKTCPKADKFQITKDLNQILKCPYLRISNLQYLF